MFVHSCCLHSGRDFVDTAHLIHIKPYVQSKPKPDTVFPSTSWETRCLGAQVRRGGLEEFGPNALLSSAKSCRYEKNEDSIRRMWQFAMTCAIVVLHVTNDRCKNLKERFPDDVRTMLMSHEYSELKAGGCVEPLKGVLAKKEDTEMNGEAQAQAHGILISGQVRVDIVEAAADDWVVNYR